MKEKTVFYCTECGNETGKWFGQCPACGRWNTLVEAPAASQTKSKSGAAKAGSAAGKNRPKRITELDSREEIRFSTGMGELDRVLGGGAVIGSLVLRGKPLPAAAATEGIEPRVKKVHASVDGKPVYSYVQE